MKNPKLYKIIKERFDYVDGDLIYKDGRRAGKIAGGTNSSHGYRNVKIEGKTVTFSGASESAKMSTSSELTAAVSEQYEGIDFIVSISQLQKAVEKTLKFKLVDNILYFKTPSIEYLVCVS